jgi:hypothetical protein
MEVSARLDSMVMLIGDHNALQIEWVGPRELDRIRIRADAWDSIPSLNWLEEAPVVHEISKSTHRYVKRLRFTVFDTLNRVLPPVELRWEEEGMTQTLAVQNLHLVVEPPTAQSNDWAPNEPIVREPLRWEDYRLYIFAVALIVGLYMLYRYYKRTVLVKEAEQLGDKPLDPHEEAFRALRALEDRGYLESEEYEAFQLELSRIVRQFLSRKFGITALESTTREIVTQLQYTAYPDKQLTLVKELLSMADLVKFAKAEPPGDFNRRMLNRAYHLVDFTNAYRS